MSKMQLEEPPTVTRAIGQSTPIQISMVVALLAIFASWIWWAATINSKLDVLVNRQTTIESTLTTIRNDVESLKAWKVEIQSVGSPKVQKLEDDVRNLTHRFDLFQQNPTGKKPT